MTFELKKATRRSTLLIKLNFCLNTPFGNKVLFPLNKRRRAHRKPRLPLRAAFKTEISLHLKFNKEATAAAAAASWVFFLWEKKTHRQFTVGR